MNSEELETSLRTEFESYLKTVVADTRQEISQLQERVENQLEKHKEQLDVVFQEAFASINAERELDPGFRESVVEHLRLSKDEGARITATAMAEAEKLESEKPVEVKDNTAEISLKFRDAVNEISGMSSQAEILKALVRHAEHFASRGAFFIIKNEHFVGWRTFGADKPGNENVIREIFFPTSAPTMIGHSVRSNSTETGFDETSQDSTLYLSKLSYESPVNQTAIPLVVRGRGVAALYVDGANLNVEALETLVRIAGLTVDLLASARTHSPKPSQSAVPFVEAPAESPAHSTNFEEPTESAVHSVDVEAATESPVHSVDFEAPTESYKPVEVFEQPPVAMETYTPIEYPHIEEVPVVETAHDEFAFETPSEEKPIITFGDDKYKEFEVKSTWDEPKDEIEEYQKPSHFEPSIQQNDYSFESKSPVVEPSFEPVDSYDLNSKPDSFENYEIESPKTVDYPFESNEFEAPKAEEPKDFSSTHDFVKEDFEPIAKTDDFSKYDFEKTPSFEVEKEETQSIPTPVVEPIPVPVAEVSPKPRFSDRNVDLPIDVAEDERRLHNDARRFARLLVSEIKLYNEQKVKDGRDSNDLYERLKEAIDRSREMYDKRVQPPVAAKFDYFHYELVNTLAENEETKLGSSYPGATI